MDKLSAICIIATIAAHNNWELEQMDVDGAYLNAPLMETIYMRQPRGYEAPGKVNSMSAHTCTLWPEIGREGVVPPPI